MPSHPIDFEQNPYVFSTPEMMHVFDEMTRYQRWLDFEAALATAQGEKGIVPRQAAEEICKKAKLEHLNFEEVRAGYRKSRNSLVPLINGLRRACEGTWGEFVHFGATTQDVLDTAEVLELRDAAKILYRDLLRLEDACLALAKAHKATPMVARTHGQQALPTTLGMKVAVWLSEIRRHIERLRTAGDRILAGQLAGAVGTMAALGPLAFEVAERCLDLLGLKRSTIAWHTSRDNIGEFASVLCLVSSTLAKIANEVFQLQKTEIGELREPSSKKALSSSTMPHKSNPAICERIVALSRHIRHNAAIVAESMAHEHERDPRNLWAEWLAMPQVCIYAGAALNYTIDLVSGLEVQTERMLGNLRLQGGLITSEWLLFRLSDTTLSDSMGKMEALELLHDLSAQAASKGISFRNAVMGHPKIGSLLTNEEADYLDHPERYVGHAVRIVEQTISEVEAKKAGDRKWPVEWPGRQ